MGSEDKEIKELKRQIKRQNLIIIVLGLVILAVYIIIAYIYRGQKFPLPNPFP
jgi:uncharacterized protein YpmB